MNNSIHSVNATNQQVQKEQAVQPPKTEQQKIRTATPQDKVEISESAKQAADNSI